MMLKKEVVKTQNLEHEKNGEYRQMLVQAIHSCAIKFPEVASTMVHLLMDFLGDSNVASAIDVVVFVREIIETNPKLRVSIITRLLDTFYQIRAARVCSCALWIIGEYCLSLSEVETGIATIKQCLGELPFFTVTEEGEVQDQGAKKVQQVNSTTVSSRRPAILADGTYATQSAALETAMSPPTFVQGSLPSTGNLRSLILSGDFFLGAVVKMEFGMGGLGNIYKPKMRRLQNIDGCYPVFLEIASRNLDSEKNIRGEELKAVADTVNEHYEEANLRKLVLPQT